MITNLINLNLRDEKMIQDNHNYYVINFELTSSDTIIVFQCKYQLIMKRLTIVLIIVHNDDHQLLIDQSFHFQLNF